MVGRQVQKDMIMKENGSIYGIDKIYPPELMIAGLERMENSGSIFYHSAKASCVEHIDCNENCCLFFLLEGQVCLEGAGYGKHSLCGKEFILLPAGAPIACRVAEQSRYAVLNCTGLKNRNNVSYLEKLRGYAGAIAPSYNSLPIRGGLDVVLDSFSVYSEHAQHRTIYDAVFILLRLLYSPKEMLLLLHPVL